MFKGNYNRVSYDETNVSEIDPDIPFEYHTSDIISKDSHEKLEEFMKIIDVKPSPIKTVL